MEHPRFKLQGHEQEVVEAYLAGNSIIKIAKMFGVSIPAAWQCLDKMKVPRRSAAPPVKTHCKRGHPLSGENLYITTRARHCRMCKYLRKAYEKKESAEPKTLLSKDPMTLEKFAKQGGKCMICEDNMTKPAVDHDHCTYVVRDLLCRSCNLALGLLQDSPEVAQKAADYLKKWKTYVE